MNWDKQERINYDLRNEGNPTRTIIIGDVECDIDLVGEAMEVLGIIKYFDHQWHICTYYSIGSQTESEHIDDYVKGLGQDEIEEILDYILN